MLKIQHIIIKIKRKPVMYNPAITCYISMVYVPGVRRHYYFPRFADEETRAE